MRPFHMKSGEKYRMMHGRKVDFASCNFAALAGYTFLKIGNVKALLVSVWLQSP